jgi:predicted Zn-dependent protease
MMKQPMVKNTKSCHWKKWLATILAIAVLFSALYPFSLSAQAGRDLSFIRDAEIEHYLHTISDPIFEAAGLNPKSVTFALVQADDLNAFVAGGMNIYIFTGLIQQADDPMQLLGVIAHETGHIADGHLVRGRKSMEQASAQAILATIIGVAAGIASGDPRAGQAIIGGGQSVAMRGFLAHSREQEAAADNAAMRYLDTARLSAKGLYEFMSKLKDQELLPADRQVEYVRTHPLTQDRIDALRHHIETAAPAGPPPAAWVEMHKRARAKLMGFINPLQALQKYSADDTSFAARYARAIAMFKRNQLSAALPAVDALLAEEPNNPYLYELKAQMLFENSRVAEAVPIYAKAVALAPESALIRTAYAHALLESGTANNAKVLPIAVDQLRESLRIEPRSPFTWRLLGTAWGRQGNEGLSAYALAEEAAANGDTKGALEQIGRAERLLPTDSPYRLKLLDLKASVERADNSDS